MKLLIKTENECLTINLFPQNKDDLRVLWSMIKESDSISIQMKDIVDKYRSSLKPVTDEKEIAFLKKTVFIDGIPMKTANEKIGEYGISKFGIEEE